MAYDLDTSRLDDLIGPDTQTRKPDLKLFIREYNTQGENKQYDISEGQEKALQPFPVPVF